MNGPFYIGEWSSDVRDASNSIVATGGYGLDEETARKNAHMVCNALNAVYYAAKASGSTA